VRKDLPDIPALAREIGHKSVNVSVYSHPRLGLAGSLSWGVWKGSENVRTAAQVRISRDESIRDWQHALDVLEEAIAMARRQLALLDVPEE